MSGDDMDAEAILDIVLGSLLGVAHAFVIATSAIWRVRKYCKGLHYSAVGFAFLILSCYFGVFLPIGGFTFLDGGKAGTKALIVALVICPWLLVSAVRGICYCVYIDGTEVVKRTFFSETRIDLKDEGAFIEDYYPHTITYWVKIYSGDNRIITFNSRRIEGDVKEFLENCKKIQLENCKKIQNAKDH